MMDVNAEWHTPLYSFLFTHQELELDGDAIGVKVVDLW